LANAVMIALAAGWLYVFVGLGRSGLLIVTEPAEIVLCGGVMLFISIIVFGIYNLIKSERRIK